MVKAGVDGVAGGARHVGHDDPLLPKNLVHQRGLAGVGLADDRHLDGVIFLFLLVLRREVLHASIQQVAGAVAVDGGDGDGIAQTQIIEFIDVRAAAAGRTLLTARTTGLPQRWSMEATS